MNNSVARMKLMERGLKVTPQRTAVLNAMLSMRDHPTADQVIDYIRGKYPNIATGTVYKILETLTLHKIIRKVNTDRDIMRYDAFLDPHHHLYCKESERIEDYDDEELNSLLGDYFEKKSIPGFIIEDIKLQITGKFQL